jgi:hypothetical protein
MKLVREYINEKFTDEYSDPIYDLGIGMISKIKEWLEKYNIKNYTINNDLTIDVNSRVYINDTIKKLPEYIKFNKCENDFDITSGIFETLQGFPKIINGNFYCGRNKLKTLEGGPIYVGRVYACHDNKLTSLKGVAEIIDGDFECSSQIIKWNPKYLPKKVGGEFRHKLQKDGIPVDKKLIVKYVDVNINEIIYRNN